MTTRICSRLSPADALLRPPAGFDKWGYGWSGGGTYIKDFGGATGRKHILIRFNTESTGMGIQYFPVDHETNVSVPARGLPSYWHCCHLCAPHCWGAAPFLTCMSCKRRM